MKLQRYAKSLRKAWRSLQNRLRGGRKVLALGDSHCGVYEYCFDHGLLAPHWLNCEIVPGATAYGMNNDHSATGAWQKFERALQRYADYDVVLIMLGECDCSYALWKIAAARGVAPETLIPRALSGVRRLVARVVDGQAAKRRIILVGAIPPTVDDQWATRQENVLRREIKATQAERTALVLEYNRQLATLASELHLDYFELTDRLLDPATNRVSLRYCGSGEDHHVSHPATGHLWAEALLTKL